MENNLITTSNVKGKGFDLSSGKVDLGEFYNNLLVGINNKLDPNHDETQDEPYQSSNEKRALQSSIDAENNSQSFDEQPISRASIGQQFDTQRNEQQGQMIPESKFDGTNTSIKLSNYGYASDTTPDQQRLVRV